MATIEWGKKMGRRKVTEQKSYIISKTLAELSYFMYTPASEGFYYNANGHDSFSLPLNIKQKYHYQKISI